MTSDNIARHTVFISSTYADLKEERKRVTEVIQQLDCIPIGMELFPAGGGSQFEYIKKQIDICDYYLLIIAGRYGTLSHKGMSYTEREFDYAVSKNIPIITFIRRDISDLPRSKIELDDKIQKKLEKFRAKASEKELVAFWQDPSDLLVQASVAIQKAKTDRPRPGYVRRDSVEAVSPVQHFESHDEQSEFYVQRLQTASTIYDLTWAKARSRLDADHDELLERRIDYVDDIADFSGRKKYIEIFIFDDGFNPRPDRLRKLQYHYNRCKNGTGGNYSCGYFDKIRFPRLQYTIIDNNEILFTAGNSDRILVAQRNLANVFRTYYESAWDDCHKLIEDGQIKDSGTIEALLSLLGDD